MSFFVYLTVLLVAAASALFGLDLLTSPLPPSPPATQVASIAVQNKLSRRAAAQAEADRKAKSSNEALTPVYPASPDGPEVRVVYPPTNETTGAGTGADKAADDAMPARPPTPEAAAVQPPAPAEQEGDTPETRHAATQPDRAPQQARGPASGNDGTAAVKATATGESASSSGDTPSAAAAAVAQPVAQPAVQQNSNRCDVQACAGAYRSFRASDCTYQPFEGPRRLCERPETAQQKTAETAPAPARATERRAERAPRQARNNEAELREVVRRVRQMTEDAEAEFDSPSIGERRIIVIERSGWR